MAISKTDETAIRHGVRAMANDRLRAYDRFASIVANKLRCDLAEGQRITGFYLKIKAIKYNGLDYVVKHGAFLDFDVLQRAQKESAKKA